MGQKAKDPLSKLVSIDIFFPTIPVKKCKVDFIGRVSHLRMEKDPPLRVHVYLAPKGVYEWSSSSRNRNAVVLSHTQGSWIGGRGNRDRTQGKFKSLPTRGTQKCQDMVKRDAYTLLRIDEAHVEGSSLHQNSE
ncbi:hypothetical protein VNO77_27612 [Canavalia gladiata]|uniref:Uncharacterized protein n=1 Tax=Canavalia gladiata TaxID=3824 RepID=A0AAN9QAN5_CANGL